MVLRDVGNPSLAVNPARAVKISRIMPGSVLPCGRIPSIALSMLKSFLKARFHARIVLRVHVFRDRVLRRHVSQSRDIGGVHPHFKSTVRLRTDETLAEYRI